MNSVADSSSPPRSSIFFTYSQTLTRNALFANRQVKACLCYFESSLVTVPGIHSF